MTGHLNDSYVTVRRGVQDNPRLYIDGLSLDFPMHGFTDESFEIPGGNERCDESSDGDNEKKFVLSDTFTKKWKSQSRCRPRKPPPPLPYNPMSTSDVLCDSRQSALLRIDTSTVAATGPVCSACMEPLIALADAVTCSNSGCNHMYHKLCIPDSQQMICDQNFQCNDCCQDLTFETEETCCACMVQLKTIDTVQICASKGCSNKYHEGCVPSKLPTEGSTNDVFQCNECLNICASIPETTDDVQGVLEDGEKHYNHWKKNLTTAYVSPCSIWIW